jgi:hypothetical protein
VIDLFKRDHAGLWIGVKVHLLTVLDAFAFPAAVIGLKLGNLRIAGLENLLRLPAGQASDPALADRPLPSLGNQSTGLLRNRQTQSCSG